MQHDISHCKGGECPLKDTCYRYLAYKELKENPGKYGLYHSFFITTPFNYGKCKHYMKAENDCS